MRIFEIKYNDGVYAGTMYFDETHNNKSIEKHINEEIKEFNTNINPMYHITRDNIQEITNK